MANIREISGRIKSIRDTMKITNAMYMISSTKMRKARKGLEGNEPYFRTLQSMSENILRNVPDIENPYLDQRPEKKGKDRTRALVVITADKGLAGAYNHNVLKMVEVLLNDDIKSKLYVVGEVGRQFFAGKKMAMAGQFQYTAQNPTLNRARVIADQLRMEFLAGEVDEVYLVFTVMKNSITSEARGMQLLPLVRESEEKQKEWLKGFEERNDHTEERLPEALLSEELHFVPGPQEVLNNVVPDMLVGYVYSALVEAYCSEQSDRMMAMDSANKNAQAMIHDLSIEFNRVRQAMITQEITEVIAGAKAQKKKKAMQEAMRREQQ